MILVDTSVWVGHLREGNSALARILKDANVLTHPFVIGELGCGNIKDRMRVLSDLGALPAAVPATHQEVLTLIEERRLWGHGIGWIDAHLLASALLSHCWFWTLDKQLGQSAAVAGVRLFTSADAQP